MCYTPCFVKATQEAFVQKRLVQCRNCGAMAFHVQDCCRDPNYIPVRTSHFTKKLVEWVGRMRGLVQTWRSQPHHRPGLSSDAATLDAWETRPIVTITVAPTGQGRAGAADEEADPAVYEASSVHR